MSKAARAELKTVLCSGNCPLNKAIKAIYLLPQSGFPPGKKQTIRTERKKVNDSDPFVFCQFERRVPRLVASATGPYTAMQNQDEERGVISEKTLCGLFAVNNMLQEVIRRKPC